MLFNTLSYLFFLLISVTLVWAVPQNIRKWVILVASLFFYGSWKVEFLLLIIFSAFIDYYFSIRIYESVNSSVRRLLLLCSLSINIGLLLYFKYAYFLAENISSIFELFGSSAGFSLGKIILPLGISFYTFLSISYTIDIYRRLFVPVRNFPLYLTYVMFWPHMIAGPILRACELIPQISENSFRPSIENLIKGLQKILIGLFLKVVLADQLAPLVDDAFRIDASQLHGLDVWTMAYAFGFQIYFDFAGYSMIAIGSAQLLNVRFPENFNWPYLAASPREFWKRWHITLSSWIRDYLYLPLTGAHYQDRSSGGIDVDRGRVSGERAALALLITWFVMGLWHGASWNFAFWGIWHAGCIYLYRGVSKVGLFAGNPILRGVFGWLITIPVVMLGWIPFRAGSLQKSFELLGKVFDFSGYTVLSFREYFYLFVFAIFAGMLLLRFLLHMRNRYSSIGWIRFVGNSSGYAVLFFLTFIFFRASNQFIYFRF